MKLIEWRKQQQERHQEPLVAIEIAPRDQVGRKKGHRRIDHGQQMERPIRYGKHGKPRRDDQRGQRRVLVTGRKVPAPSECLDQIWMQPDRGIRYDLKAGPDRNEQPEKNPQRRAAVFGVVPAADPVFDNGWWVPGGKR